MFSNPRVNPTLERILLLDQDIYEQPGQPAFDARQGASRLAAVSYTHLDVYKRQVLERFPPQTLFRLSNLPDGIELRQADPEVE